MGAPHKQSVSYQCEVSEGSCVASFPGSCVGKHPLIHWCSHSLVFSFTGVLIHWCSHSLVFSFTRVLIHWCSHSLVFSFTGVLIHWCSHSLVFSFTGVLIRWCSHSLVFSLTGVLIRSCSQLFREFTLSAVVWLMEGLCTFIRTSPSRLPAALGR